MPRCLLLMLWTAPAPRDRSAVDWLSQPERFKKVRQATTVAFEVEGIGEDRRGNADKVDPGIGTTRMGQRIFECVLSIGTRSAQSIMASGFTAAQTGRTHDRTRPMLQKRQKVLAKAAPLGSQVSVGSPCPAHSSRSPCGQVVTPHARDHLSRRFSYCENSGLVHVRARLLLIHHT